MRNKGLRRINYSVAATNPTKWGANPILWYQPKVKAN